MNRQTNFIVSEFYILSGESLPGARAISSPLAQTESQSFGATG